MRGWLLILAAWPGWARPHGAVPGYSVWGDFKYAPGFQHCDYVNADAPKNGELRMESGLRVAATCL